MNAAPRNSAAPRRDLRALGLLLAGALLGAAWGWLTLQQVGQVRDAQALRALVWVIVACPLLTLLGWLLAARRELWRALAVTGAIYFFSVFVAARFEQLAIGREQAAATGHALYFQAVLACQLAMASLAALTRGLRPPAAR